MRHLLTSTALVGVLAALPAAATSPPTTGSSEPTVMVGLSFDFGRDTLEEGIGLTVKGISSNQPDHFVGGAGVSYFPFAKDRMFGIDASAGYTFDNGAVMGGLDVLNMQPQLSAGWADTSPKRRVLLVSDRRLKRDVRLLGVLANGMKIYRFRYLWSDVVQVGVMAQDLLRRREWRDAVVRLANGYFAVDYAALGLA
jgi:hypothetical protein